MDEPLSGTDLELEEHERVNYSLIAKIEPHVEVHYCSICHQAAVNILVASVGRHRGEEIIGALCDVHLERFSRYLEQRAAS